MFQGTLHAAAKVIGIEGGKALVKHHHPGTLKQGTRNEQSAALAMRKLPAAFPHHLHQPCRHAIEQLAKTQPAAEVFRFEYLPGGGGPAASHQEIECKCLGKDVVLMELRRCGDFPPPTLEAQ